MLVTAAWLVVFAYRHVPYDNELWWQFAFHASAPRSLRASLLAAMIAAAYGLWRRAAAGAAADFGAERRGPGARRGADREGRGHHGESCAARRQEPAVQQGAHGLHHVPGLRPQLGGDGRPGRVRRSAAKRWRGSFWRIATCMAVSPVFYQVKPQNLPLYIDLGLELEQTRRRGARAARHLFPGGRRARGPAPGAPARAAATARSSRWCRAPRVAAILPELRAVSDAWLAAKNTAEKRFSLGFFDERYLANFDCGVVRRGGAIVAFANLWRGGSSELSVDLMRYNDAAPKGVIDYLLIECMLWGKAQGFQLVQSGDGAAVGAGRTRAGAHLAQARALVQRYGETFYQLRRPAKIQGEISCRCGVRDIWRRRTASPWPARCSMSPR